MRSKTIRWSMTLTVLLFGSQGLAGESPLTPDVLRKVHESNQKEIQMGKVAEKEGMSIDVKAFGRMLVKDHSAADKKVLAFAKKENVDFRATSPSTGEDEDMSSMPAGSDFDLHFAQAMLEDHIKDISEVTAARDNTPDKRLKELLSEMLPTLRKHQEKAQSLVDQFRKQHSEARQ